MALTNLLKHMLALTHAFAHHLHKYYLLSPSNVFMRHYMCAENSYAKVSATEVAVIHNKHLILVSLQSKGEKMSKSEPRKKPMQPKEPTLTSHFCLSSLPFI